MSYSIFVITFDDFFWVLLNFNLFLCELFFEIFLEYFLFKRLKYFTKRNLFIASIFTAFYAHNSFPRYISVNKGIMP